MVVFFDVRWLLFFNTAGLSDIFFDQSVSVGLGETPARTMDDVSACFSVIQSLRFEFSVFQTRAVRRLWRGLKMIDLTGSQIPLLPGSSTCCFHVIY